MASLSLAFDILAKDRASKVFNDVGNAADDAGKKGGKLGGVLASAAKGGVAAIATAAAAAGAGLVAFGVASIRAASDAEQSTGAIESVFGKASKQVQAFADTSALRLGLSANAYRELASVVGSQLKNMGQSQDEAAKSSDKLVSLGADLAATFGGSVADAVGAVGSLLRGERDPIERYGVAIKDADIKARLAAEGNDKLTGAALKTATAQATLKLLSEQTAGSLGAFGRESDTLAGRQERLRARFDDVKAAVGARLLPVVTDFVGFLLNKGVPAFERLIAKVVENQATFVGFGKGLAQVLVTVVQGFALFLQASLTVLAKLNDGYIAITKDAFSFARGTLAAFDAALGWIPGYETKFKAAGIVLDVYEKTVINKAKGASAALNAGAAVAGQAANAVGGLRAQIDKLQPKEVVAKANVGGADNVRQLESAINRLRDKTVTVTTIQRTVIEAQKDGKGGGVQARALGGPVSAGRPYLVGERGPELIVPSQSGNVLTAGQTKQALAGNTYNVNVAAVDTVQLVSTLKRLEALNA